MSDSQQPNLQRLLELHYDLLPDDEAVELRAEIERDAELSRAFDNCAPNGGPVCVGRQARRAAFVVWHNGDLIAMAKRRHRT